MNETYYTVKEFAALMKVHENTVYNWIEENKIQIVKIGGTIRIPASSFSKIEPIKE